MISRREGSRVEFAHPRKSRNVDPKRRARRTGDTPARLSVRRDLSRDSFRAEIGAVFNPLGETRYPPFSRVSRTRSFSTFAIVGGGRDDDESSRVLSAQESTREKMEQNARRNTRARHGTSKRVSLERFQAGSAVRRYGG